MSACWMSLIKDELLKRRPMRVAVVLLICATRLFAFAEPSSGQTATEAPAAAPATQDDVERLKSRLAAQQEQINELRKRLEARQRLLEKAIPGAIAAPTPDQNIKRDPFEQAVGVDQKTAMSLGGALGAPATAFQYDWNMLPIGQRLWLEHLITYKTYPPLQAPETYNLSQVLEQVKKANHPGD